MVGNENSDQTQKNPWDVLSLHQFQNFCCPSCVYKVPEKQDFIEHAYKNHPAWWFSVTRFDYNKA